MRALIHNALARTDGRRGMRELEDTRRALRDAGGRYRIAAREFFGPRGSAPEVRDRYALALESLIAAHDADAMRDAGRAAL